MAPRKNNDKKQTANKKKSTLKAPKLAVKKAKLKPKSQGAVKLKIPVSASTLKKTMRKKTVSTSKARTPKITKKQLTVQENIELANEVANTQLVKKEVPSDTLEPQYVITITRAEPPSKRGRKTKPVETSDTVPVKIEQTDSEEAFEATPKKRTYVRKEASKVPQAIPKRSTKTSKSLVPPKNTELKKKKNLEQTKPDISTDVINTPNKPRKTVKRTAEKKMTNSTPTPRKKKLDTPLGKLGIETSSTEAQDSPSLLEQVECKSPKTDFVFESPKNLNILASPVESRKTSTTCVSDIYAWTKDLSSSSSTTCVSVSSSDFVRIDNRVPIIKINNVDYKLKTMQREDSSSNSSTSTNTFTPKTPVSSPKIDTYSLDLSTSSVTSPKLTKSQSTTCQSIEQNNQTLLSKKDVILEKLTKKLKNVDLEIINWIGYDSDIAQIPDNIAQLQERTIKLFQNESDVIYHCQCIKKALKPKQHEETASKEDHNENSHSVPLDTNKNETLNEKGVESNKNDGRINDKSHWNNNVPLHRPVSNKIYENKFNFDRVKHTTDDLSYDDDDTLSLFAESITAMDSSKMDITETNSNNILIEPLEEYIPQSIAKDKWKSPININYVPSKITKDSAQSTDVKKTVCEKQNADSTSLFKDIEQMKNCKPVTADKSQIVVQKDVTGSSSQYKTWMDSEIKKTPRLMSSLYKSLPGVKSVVFRGICFYNMISGCKNPVCRFPHVNPELEEINMKLVRLSEEFFVQEYMLIRNWPILRRKYGMVFVEECKRRDLTRHLVEMAIDFYMKANDNFREDAILKVEVAEYVLMHLNTVDLNSCEDLLLYSLQRDYRLCDMFMQTIADTQNFSRFKKVYINLTNFMTHHRRKFALDVATHMLERLCLLPSEQPLSEALLTILENTDIAIFQNSMMVKFEKQIKVLNNNLYERYKALKAKCQKGPVIKSLMDITPCPNPEQEITIKQMVQNDRGKRYTSPDTTNLDNMNKALDDVIIHRTIDLSNLKNQRSTSLISSHSSDSNEENRGQCVSKPSPDYRNWKGQTVFNKISSLSPVNLPRHFPGPISRHIYQRNQHGTSPPNFARRFGPDF